ncbi:peroxiredoxin 2/4 [Pancytospora philotis]|nr:peroxiredoxin 2/4 [Pancytospora philotis]
MIFPSTVADYEYKAVVNREIVSVKLSDAQTKYIVLVFYPLDFTFVCPTEIVKFSQMSERFREEGATIFFVSCDSVYSHQAWARQKVEENGLGDISCPIISDIARRLVSQFNLFNEANGTAMRATVIMDRDFNVKHMSANADEIGRSTDEVLRLIRALNFSALHGNTICPVDFQSSREF